MNNFKRVPLIARITLLVLVAFGVMTPTASASSALPPTIIEDFEDGDTSDWLFFPGNLAGGGGGPADDRPQEGNWYLSTGWGGEGSDSGFYGGMFRNFDNAEQITPPVDPWFNVWVLNQSDATVDNYSLEITLREDVDGNGWTNGAEDSVQLSASFTSTDLNDEWVLISAPLSSFTNLGTGGNGSFDGNLDEVVIVVAGVAGASGAVVEVDFDQLSFTSSAPLGASQVVFDDMEHGDPFGNGWFAFGGSVGGGGIGPDSTDLPPTDGGAFSLGSGWGSGGVPGFFGGFGRTNPIELPAAERFSFWINPNADQEYTLEINLQDDDNGDNAATEADDDEFQYNCVISPVGPCAISGGGWQQISIPLADFFYDGSFLFGGNGVFDPVAESSGGNGQLVNVVVAVIGNSGSDVNFRTDFWQFAAGADTGSTQIVDDFENGLPLGTDANGTPVGFYTFSDNSPVAIATATEPPAPVPGGATPNNVLAMTANVTAFAGFIHGFENAAVDTWVPQDWSAFEGFSVWFYGLNTGTTLFVDVLDNRNPGSTGDDAERYSVTFADDFSGWRQLEFSFADFVRKEVGNGAPNDGFTLTAVHGWALGTLATPGSVTFYADDAALYGTAEIPELMVSFSTGGYSIEEGQSGNILVKLNRPMNSDDPAMVSVDYATQPAVAIPGRDYQPTYGTLTFVNGGASEQSFELVTFDNNKWEGDKPIALVLEYPADVALGFIPRATAFIIENDPFDPNLLDDFEAFPWLWEPGANTVLSVLELLEGDPWERPGQASVEGVLRVDSPLVVDVRVNGNACKGGNGLIPVTLLSSGGFDALSIDHTSVTLGNASEAHVDKKTGLARRHVEDVDNDGAPDLVLHFRARETGLDCRSGLFPISGETLDGQPIVASGEGTSLRRDFPIGQDWSHGEALGFWYYGTGSGATVNVQLHDNRAPDPGPGGWGLVWSEEFDEPAGTLPNPQHWSYELGDGSLNGIPGWGNEELQYYTDEAANAATDGQGNMVLTVREADGSLDCYYGPCEYTSARLISKRKAEFAYGRVEARIRVPEGQGLWPAFWSLGTDIDLVNWPQTGEIDFMEFVGRLPNEVFGTIHGPGYSGGQSFGNIYTFDEPVFNDYHTFTVEWEPDLIKWYVDGILYHSATPADLDPNEWVFNDPVFLLLNVAVGGNFGGAVGDDLELPQSMTVDYIRVYQADDTAERFESSFVDSVTGWQQVELPFAGFARSAEQPPGAPDDGLTLTEVWGYGFQAPQGGSFLLDQVRVQVPPPPAAIVVSNLNDAGDGSLREALSAIAAGGSITFDPALAGGSIALVSGPLVLDRNLSIAGPVAGAVTIDGGGANRLLIVEPGVVAMASGMNFSNGYGYQLAGGILNNGVLTLDHVRVSNNTMTTDGGDFWQGGGGIYNGEWSTLNLIDSTVSGNNSGWTGGGVYSFFNTSTHIERSTINDNFAQDVGGGLRTLGAVTVINSTIDGNTAANWHGGAAFITDGLFEVTNSTVSDNTSPAGTAGGFFVGTFGEASATLALSNSIVSDNGGLNCFPGFFGPGTVTLASGGNNIASDTSCFLIESGDQENTDPLLDSLSDNGGATLTRALIPGSPAIDAAGVADCPVIDQRGVLRPQGAACDVGAFELVP
jgi:beta-glucanase (GH16 family)